MYIYMYVYIYMCIYIYMYVIDVYIYMYIDTHACIVVDLLQTKPWMFFCLGKRRNVETL